VAAEAAVKVSTFFTLAKASAKGPDRKRLNLCKLTSMERLLRHAGTKCVKRFRTSQHRSGEHMKSILDPSFRYTKSVETDLRKTFARVRRELRRQTQQSASVEAMRKVLPFQSRKGTA
jgi:hypothetical protein